MADTMQQLSDELPISFDLGTLFGSDDTELNELNQNDVPDSELCELLDAVNENYPAIVQNVGAIKPVTDKGEAPTPKKN